jgi:Flp pilus assembly protein TadG
MGKQRPETSLSKPDGRQGFRAGSRAWRGRMTAFSRNESGTVAIITAILMVVLLGFLALAVDVGHLATVKNELQNAADAAALAGARALVFKEGAMVQKITPVPDPPYCAQAINWAQNTINQSDAKNLTISSVQTGVWDWPNNTFTPSVICQAGVNAVHVVVQRDAASNWPVATWFARIFGVDTVNASAQATAACGYLNEYCDWAPIALTTDFYNNNQFPSESQLDTSYTPQNTIMFYPDQGDDGGWCLTTQNPTPPTLTNAIENPASNGCLSLDGTSTVYLNNGNLVPGIRAVQEAIANSGDSYDPTNPCDYNPDDPLNSTGPDPCWNVIVPVVQRDMTDQLNQQATVDRFALIRITGAYTPNDPNNPTVLSGGTPRFLITFYLLDGDFQVPGTSGGVVSNLFATQPALVQ